MTDDDIGGGGGVCLFSKPIMTSFVSHPHILVHTPNEFLFMMMDQTIHIRSRVRQLTLILLNKAQKLPGGYLFSPDLLTNIRHEWTPALNSRFFQGGGKFHKSSFRGGYGKAG